MRKAIVLVLLLIFLGAGGYVLVRYYSYIFAKRVNGEVIDVERVTQPSAIVGGNVPQSQVFSFAVAIKDLETNEIFTASSEDRQWAVVHKGQCAEAKFFPYEPWEFEKSGSYFGARLVRLYECPTK